MARGDVNAAVDLLVDLYEFDEDVHKRPIIREVTREQKKKLILKYMREHEGDIFNAERHKPIFRTVRKNGRKRIYLLGHRREQIPGSFRLKGGRAKAVRIADPNLEP